jgi:hypothetical protein
MILTIVSLLRNSLSGLMGLNFTSGAAISSPIDSKKGKKQITFEGSSRKFTPPPTLL